MPMQFTEFVVRVLTDAGHALEGAAQDQSIWSMSSAVPRLTVSEVYDGTLGLHANLPGHASVAALSIALTAGEARIGVMLPQSAVTHGAQDLAEKIALIYNGSKPAINRVLSGGRALLDWHFHDDPFSARFMCEAVSDEVRRGALVHALSYAAMTIWRGTVEVIATAGRFDLAHDLMVITDREISRSDLIKRIPCLIYDQMYESQSSQWYTVLRSDLDAQELIEALKKAGVTSQVRPMIRAQEFA
jgi:hypothetical protein